MLKCEVINSYGFNCVSFWILKHEQNESTLCVSELEGIKVVKDRLKSLFKSQSSITSEMLHIFFISIVW